MRLLRGAGEGEIEVKRARQRVEWIWDGDKVGTEIVELTEGHALRFVSLRLSCMSGSNSHTPMHLDLLQSRPLLITRLAHLSSQSTPYLTRYPFLASSFPPRLLVNQSPLEIFSFHQPSSSLSNIPIRFWRRCSHSNFRRLSSKHTALLSLSTGSKRRTETKFGLKAI